MAVSYLNVNGPYQLCLLMPTEMHQVTYFLSYYRLSEEDPLDASVSVMIARNLDLAYMALIIIWIGGGFWMVFLFI